LAQKEAVVIIDAILEVITAALAKGEKVELRGFGSFGAKMRRGRIARNPKTGEQVATEVKAVAYFKPSKYLKKTLIEGGI